MSDSTDQAPQSSPKNVGPTVSPSIPEAQFSEEQRERLGDWFREQWRHGECPVCHKNSWAAPDKAWELRPYRGGQTVIGGPGGILPMFPITCTTCGYIVWINAIVSGVLGKRTPKGPTA
jgi:hypothetical protein